MRSNRTKAEHSIKKNNSQTRHQNEQKQTRCQKEGKRFTFL